MIPPRKYAIMMRSTGHEPEPRRAPVWMKLTLVSLFATGLGTLLYVTIFT